MKAVIVWLVVMVVNLAGYGQRVGVRVGHSLVPADYLSLRYEHWTNGQVNFALAGFFERSRKNLLNYTSYGADLLAEYSPLVAGDPLPFFSWRAGIGLTGQVEWEPWLYKDLSFSQRLSYGAVGEGSLDCHLTEAFRLSLFVQQKYFLRRAFAAGRFCFGLGLSYRLDNF